MAQHVFDVVACGDSHVGLVRQINEDRFLVSIESGLFAVADGMGGHDAGEVASTEIIDRLQSIGRPSSALDLRARFEDRVHLANAEILGIAASRGRGVMGATLAALLIFEARFACVWSGDSRVYHWRDNRLTQLTHDHTEVQALVDTGVLSVEDARSWPRRNVIRHAIGVDEYPFLEIVQGLIEAGDRFLICSDGLTAHVEDAEIGDVLRNTAPDEACRRLIDLTLERGATDNVSVVVVAIRPATPLGEEVALFADRGPEERL
ncbi:protein phosphatase 2C domain-containing protein [Mesorhizobium sp. BR1-1-16]|uniref:PP2C family protein-serine/threonine phosphatase n=1 Tax=Mesorhizobium sp. BR1-1-16 TaxID=2876653 RepID=UPI001CCEC6A4|nr:protein phosphatase 2C domain-containing protein [Mesorhizobium sp. BR1-1-16]MBZ9938991.1 protein phosphatase 2C domain-containing protein [Mesorhizobium sp. BR1-1-16]